MNNWIFVAIWIGGFSLVVGFLRDLGFSWGFLNVAAVMWGAIGCCVYWFVLR